ncbi:MAG: MBOAT family O-acyltransferase [Methylocystaceae bacterium]
MVFSSLIFLYLFLPLCLTAYFITRKPIIRNTVLIIFSLVFYAWGEPVWISLLLFTAFFDWLNGLLADKYQGHWQSRMAVIFSVTLNLLVLGFFKYSGFLVSNINDLFNIALPIKQYSLPLGISFYTFQSISYVVDVYQGKVRAQRSPFTFLLYVSLFHHLVAGPIIRYKDIAHEIWERKITWGLFSEGVNRFAIGLAKKVILANNLGEAADLILKGNLQDLTILGAWFGVALFSLQIYFDFSGYSDMAIGLGKMFGFHYKENFNFPYISRSATEFWRRWHMSLGSFFRDYVYIPLGGNRRWQYRNLAVVWFLTGLWHGASWNFVLWGLYYGVLVALEKLFLLRWLEKIPRVVSHIYLLIAAMVGWVFFYFIDLGRAVDILKIMGGHTASQWWNTATQVMVTNNLLVFLLAVLSCTPLFLYIDQMLEARAKPARPLINAVILVLATVLLVGKTYNPFLYFRF